MQKPYLFLFITSLAILSACNNKPEKKQVTVTPTDTTSAAKPDLINNPYAPVDISPMDMSYYPPDYPKLKMVDSVRTPPVARLIYSRPHLQGRKLFVDLLKYGEPWRLGANEATDLQLYQDVTIQGRKVKAGRYVLYCIPQEKTWTIIFNSNIDSWGLKPDPSKDLFSFAIPVKQTNYSIEFFTMVFEKMNGGAELVMTWDNWEARLPLNF
jgi:hypothetical protein